MDRHSQLLEVVRAVVKHAPNNKSAESIADEIGKAYSALMNELNPAVDSHKLGAATMLDIMRATGSDEPLHAMAAMHGGVFLRVHGPNAAVSRDDVVFRCADFMREVSAPSPDWKALRTAGYALQCAVAGFTGEEGA